jgi:hypothetical protein
LLDINYGVGERVQLKLKPRLVILDEPGQAAEAGAGNIQLGKQNSPLPAALRALIVAAFAATPLHLRW